MIVTIWRHGTAKEGVNDRMRELTIAGRDDVSFGCRQFQQACTQRDILPITAVLHSPWVRTTQTADIIATKFGAALIENESALRPGGDLRGVDNVIAKFKDQDNGNSNVQHLALVSHQPLVSRLVDHCLGDMGRVPPIPAGGLVTLSFDVPAPACGKLLFWAFPPVYEAVV